MKQRKNTRPLGTLTLILTLFIFVIILIVMSLQAIFMYLYWKLLYQIDGPLPAFWRPIPLLAVLSAIVGAILTWLLSWIPLKPIRELIDAINLLAQGDFHVRISLDTTQEFLKLSDSFNRMAQELENTEMLRSDFINNFSHEFKTPIVSLRGFAKLLKNQDLSPALRNEYLDIIISESTRLSQLSSNVLNLSKIENLNILRGMELFNLSEEIRQSILLLQSKWQKINLDFSIDIEEQMYYGNKSLLNQVWINLLDNAIKFSYPEGRITIKLCKRQNGLLFHIQDNGCGMDEETTAHIFDRFYQFDPSHTTEGNGLGLTVVQKVIKLHNGTIKVTSKRESGTIFEIILPR